MPRKDGLKFRQAPMRSMSTVEAMVFTRMYARGPFSYFKKPHSLHFTVTQLLSSGEEFFLIEERSERVKEGQEFILCEPTTKAINKHTQRMEE